MTLPIQPKAHDRCPRCKSIDTVIRKTERISRHLTLRYHQCRTCHGSFQTEDIPYTLAANSVPHPKV